MSIATATTQIDNERTIVTQWAFKPGVETGVHIHEYDYCVLPLIDGVLKIVAPDGTETMSEMQAGASYFRNMGVHHNVINANDFDYAFFEVEFK